MDAPIRILAIVPEPAGVPWAPAAAAAWTALSAALRGAIDAGAVQIVRLTPPTANAFDQAAQREPFDIVHLAAHGVSRPAARYGTVTLEGSDRRARDLNAQNFARLCAQVDGLQLAVIQAVGGPSADLSVLCDAVLQHAGAVLSLPAGPRTHDGADPAEFARAFYSAAATGESIESAFAIASRNRSLAPASTDAASAAKLLRREGLVATGRAPVRTIRTREPSQPPLPPAEWSTPPGARTDTADREAAAVRELERKRLAGDFDVFLCHNVGDKPEVMEIGRRLMKRGVLPWLDQWELRPGTPWQRVLEEQIARIAAAAVFVGRDGIGPWQRQELDGFLREFNKRGCPVIPVMLPGAGGEPQLPLFLRGMTWVDFRLPEPDPLAQLVWGITGQRPAAL